MHILLNISLIQGNQTMKFGQLIEDPKRNIFINNYTENETGKLVPDGFLFFKKALYQVKASRLELDFSIFRQPSNQHTVETLLTQKYA